MSAADSLRENFFAMAKRVESLSGLIDPKEPSTLVYAQSILSAVTKDLEAMTLVGDRMEGEPDAPGVTLMSEIRSLLGQTQGLKAHIDKAIEIQSSMPGGMDGGTEQPQPPQQQHMPPPPPHEQEQQTERDAVKEFVNSQGDVPLDRQEIAKLLLLICRAEKSGILSKKQKDFLKTQVVARTGMLRVILQLQGIEMIMQALKAISGEE
jgi:hypothetical protein